MSGEAKEDIKPDQRNSFSVKHNSRTVAFRIDSETERRAISPPRTEKLTNREENWSLKRFQEKFFLCRALLIDLH